MNHDYLQDGYGVIEYQDRIGVRNLANHGIIAGTTLFWHTGGVGELEFYKHDLFHPV